MRRSRIRAGGCSLEWGTRHRAPIPAERYRSLVLTIAMAQTSARNRLVDIFLDPMAAAILASIGLHASIGASLPYWLPPQKPGVTNPGTDTVKVVELTPNELQRIPQVAMQPTPAPAATPTPQATTPVVTTQPQPTAQPKPATQPQPTPPKFGTAPLRIPFAPVPASGRQVVPAPAAKPNPPARTTSPAGKPARKSSSTKQTETAIVDPEDFFPDTETTIKPAVPKGNKIRPTTQPSPAVTTPTQPKKSQPQPTVTNIDRQDSEANDNTDRGNGNSQPTTAPSRQNPAGNRSPSAQPGTRPSTQSPQPEEVDANGSNTGNGNRGIPAAMQSKLQEYRAKYPGLQVYQSSATPAYPPNVATCLQGQPAVYVMVIFDKFPDGQDANILGSTTANPLVDPSNPYVRGDAAILKNTDLKMRAVGAGLALATAKDTNRAIADRHKQVVYINRVTLDPSTCK